MGLEHELKLSEWAKGPRLAKIKKWFAWMSKCSTEVFYPIGAFFVGLNDFLNYPHQFCI